LEAYIHPYLHPLIRTYKMPLIVLLSSALGLPVYEQEQELMVLTASNDHSLALRISLASIRRDLSYR
jgi:hypothetical protein